MPGVLVVNPVINLTAMAPTAGQILNQKCSPLMKAEPLTCALANKPIIPVFVMEATTTSGNELRLNDRVTLMSNWMQ